METVTTFSEPPDGALEDRYTVLVSALEKLGFDRREVASPDALNAVDADRRLGEQSIVVDVDGDTVVGRPDRGYSDVVLDVLLPEAINSEASSGKIVEENDKASKLIISTYHNLRKRAGSACRNATADSVLFTSHGTLDRDEDNLRGMEAALFNWATWVDLEPGPVTFDRRLVVMTGWGVDDMGDKIVTELEPTHIVTEGGTQLFEPDPETEAVGEPEPLYDAAQRRDAVDSWGALLSAIRTEFDDPVLFTQGNRVGVCVYVNPTPAVVAELTEPASTPFTGGAPADEVAEIVTAEGLPITNPDEIGVGADAVGVRATGANELRFDRPAGVDSAAFRYSVEKTLARYWTLLPYEIVNADGTALDVRLLGTERLGSLTDDALGSTEAERILDEVTDGTYDQVPEGAGTKLYDIAASVDADNVEAQTDCCVDVFVQSKGESFRDGKLLERLGCDPGRTNIDYVSKGTGSDKNLIENMYRHTQKTDCSLTCRAPSDAPEVLTEGLSEVVDVADSTDPTEILADMYLTTTLYDYLLSPE